eukprot:scaffold28481_cov129-Isochrysis_galbana.AAC.5
MRIRPCDSHSLWGCALCKHRVAQIVGILGTSLSAATRQLAVGIGHRICYKLPSTSNKVQLSRTRTDCRPYTLCAPSPSNPSPMCRSYLPAIACAHAASSTTQAASSSRTARVSVCLEALGETGAWTIEAFVALTEASSAEASQTQSSRI